jgi:hypothetical protein
VTADDSSASSSPDADERNPGRMRVSSLPVPPCHQLYLTSMSWHPRPAGSLFLQYPPLGTVQWYPNGAPSVMGCPVALKRHEIFRWSLIVSKSPKPLGRSRLSQGVAPPAQLNLTSMSWHARPAGLLFLQKPPSLMLQRYPNGADKCFGKPHDTASGRARERLLFLPQGGIGKDSQSYET